MGRRGNVPPLSPCGGPLGIDAVKRTKWGNHRGLILCAVLSDGRPSRMFAFRHAGFHCSRPLLTFLLRCIRAMTA